MASDKLTETTNPNFDKNTCATDVASAFPDSIKDRTVLITGVNKAGIGFGTAEAFASQSPRHLILAGRSRTKVQECVNDLRSRYPNVDIRALLVDLSSQESIRHAAAEITGWADIPSINLIINNAGLMRQGMSGDGPVPTNRDGIEDMFATNHLGHFLLTNLIMPKIIAGCKDTPRTPSRIINVSSSGAWLSPLRSSDLTWSKTVSEIPANEHPNFKFLRGAGMEFDETTPYIPTLAYGHSKTCNILFSVGLNGRLFEKYSILSIALNPGEVRSELTRNTDPILFEQMIDKRTKAGLMHWKTVSQGASTTMVAACDPKLSLPSSMGHGQYLDNCQIAQAPPHAVDKQAAEKLWQLSEELTGDTFKY